MSEKLKLWESLERTEKKHTKNFNRAGFKGTAISPAYTCKKLTEAFGPCGSGWKFVQEDEKYVEGHTLSNGDKSIIHVVRGHLEYQCPVTGEKCETGPQYGHTVFVGENKNGVFTDDECQKKSVTDCLGKCAVLLGCSADVYLGIFDSSKYVNDRTQSQSRATRPAGRAVPRKSEASAATPVADTKRALPKRKVGAKDVPKPASKSKPVKKKPVKKKPVKKKPAAKRKVSAAKSKLPAAAAKRWVPAQFAEWLSDSESPVDLEARYSAIRQANSTTPETLKVCIEACSTAMREKVEKGTTSWETLTEYLLADKKVVDANK